MPSEMSYAQALNDAKQMIIQQQYRIKADADRIKAQQQTIVDQSATLVENERRIKEQAADLQRLDSDLEAMRSNIQFLKTANGQAEAVIDRQGERLTTLQAAAAEMEQRVAEQAGRIADLTGERDALKGQMPSREDAEALSAMADLLSKRPAGMKRSSMRMADDATEQPTAPQAEAA